MPANGPWDFLCLLCLKLNIIFLLFFLSLSSTSMIFKKPK